MRIYKIVYEKRATPTCRTCCNADDHPWTEQESECPVGSDLDYAQRQLAKAYDWGGEGQEVRNPRILSAEQGEWTEEGWH